MTGGRTPVILIFSFPIRSTVSNVTFRDLEEFSKCPYRFRYARSESYVPAPSEFVDAVVHSVISRMNALRLTRGSVTEDEALEEFWDCWDESYGLHPPRFKDSSDRITHLHMGEDLVRTYVRMVSRYGSPRILMNDIHSVQQLPGGNGICIDIDEVCMRGETVLLCRYVTDGLRTRTDMESDRSMNIALLWALYNIPGAEYAVACWRLLSTATEFESPTDRGSLTRTAVDVGRDVGVLRAAVAFPPKACDLCPGCPVRSNCPRFAHADSLPEDPDSRSMDEGVRMVDAYRELEEKKRALKDRIAMLEERQRELSESIVGYADGHGYNAVNGSDCYVVVSHQKKVVLPEDKTDVIEHLKRSGSYERYSMVNYPRLRSDIMKGQTDAVLRNMAMVVPDDRLYLKRKS